MITVTLVALAVLTLVAFVAAPLIFRLYTIEPGRRRRRRPVPPRRHAAHRGSSCSRSSSTARPGWPTRSSTPAAGSSPRRGARSCPTSIIIATLLSLPVARATASWDLADVLDRRPAALDARPRRDRRHRGDGRSSLIPAVRAGRPALHADARSSATRPCAGCCGCRAGRSATSIANQVTVVGRAQPGRPGLRRRPRLLQRVHVLRAAPRPAGGVDRHDVRARRWPAPSTRRDRRAFCDQASLGIRLDRAARRCPAGVLIFVLRRPIVGALLQHGEFTAADADTASRALGGFALGLVGFSRVPVRAARLLRPPGHPHAVRHQRRPERAQHRAGLRPRRRATASSGWPPRSPSPTSCARCGRCRCCRTRCPASRCATSLAQPVADGRRRRRSPAR